MEEDTAMNEKMPDRPPRSKARLAFTIALWLVMLLLFVVIVSPVRDAIFNHSLTTALTATPTIVSGGGSVYIQADPPGTITIDERVVTKLPRAYNGDKPIVLLRGQHKIVWQSPPFQPLSCIINVPPTAIEPCNYESNVDATNAPATRLITFTPSITDLPNTQQAALKQAIQNTLNTLQSTTTMQPGEHYVSASSSGIATVKTATQPLLATLHFHLDANLASQNSCVTGYNDSCSDSGQSCLQLCTNIFGSLPTTSTQPTWDINALFYPTWTYTTQSGQVIAKNQPDASSFSAGTDHSIDLSATWDGAKWHVSPYIAAKSLQFSHSPACASISNQITPTTYGTTANGTNVTWGFAVGTNEAAGCLGIVVPNPQSPQTPVSFKPPAAYFLYRFGVLLAANPLAHHYFPNLPVADTYEQGLAQHIGTGQAS